MKQNKTERVEVRISPKEKEKLMNAWIVYDGDLSFSQYVRKLLAIGLEEVISGSKEIDRTSVSDTP